MFILFQKKTVNTELNMARWTFSFAFRKHHSSGIGRGSHPNATPLAAPPVRFAKSPTSNSSLAKIKAAERKFSSIMACQNGCMLGVTSEIPNYLI